MRVCLLTLSFFILPLLTSIAQTFERISDIASSSSSFPSHFFVFNNRLYFSANDGANNPKLYVTDGTPGGTKHVSNLKLTRTSMMYQTANGKYFVWATDGTNSGLWAIDGTGPEMFLGNLIPRSNIVVLNNKIFLSAVGDAGGSELWCSDGTVAGTQKVNEINPNGDGCWEEIIVFQNQLYFRGDATGSNGELWRSDGTAQGTVLFKEINNSAAGNPFAFFEFNNHLYFRACDTQKLNGGYRNVEPWVSDGTAAGTQILKDLQPGIQGSNKGAFFSYNNKLWFCGSFYGIPPMLYVSDGTAAGTDSAFSVPNFPAAFTNENFSSFPFAYHFLQLLDNKLFFAGTDSLMDTELWVFDGTDTGTHRLKDLCTFHSSDPEALTVFDNKLFFEALDSTNGRSLWMSDGTAAGTHLAITGGPFNILIHTTFQEFNGSLYFAAQFDNAGVELWRYNPSGTSVDRNTTRQDPALYPNPAYDKLWVEVEGSATVEIHDLSGRILMIRHVNRKADIDISGLAPGIYLVAIEGQALRKRFIKN